MGNGCIMAKHSRLLNNIGSVCCELVRRYFSAAADNPSGIILYDDIDLIPSAGANCYSYCVSNYLRYLLDHREVKNDFNRRVELGFNRDHPYS